MRPEEESGVSFPADFREITDAYGPVLTGGKLYLDHPGHPIRNPGEEIRESTAFWREEDSAELLPAGAGSAPGELLPVAAGTTAETVFLQIPVDQAAPWTVAVRELDSGEFVLYEMTFAGRLPAFLRGEDVMAGSSFPDHPFCESLT